MSDENDIDTSTLSETSNFMIWKANEPDGEETFHLELGTVTVHFFAEEWQEFMDLVRSIN